MNNKIKMLITGLVIGLVVITLSFFGNPGNMAFCIACFIRDQAGAMGFHRAEPVQYMRPEIMGIVLGAFCMAFFRKEHSAKGGSATLTRFVLGICVMIGALIFLGCPLRMLLRIAGGDLNAVIALVGFVAGIGTGVIFLNKGFSLKKTYDLPKSEGYIFPIINILLIAALVAFPSILFFSESGPGAAHAPIYISLAAGLIVGVIAQKERICFVSGIRDSIMFKDFRMVICLAAILVTVLIGNIVMGKFNLGFEGQPVAHTEFIWNFLGLYLVGFASVLLGGCPLRQLVLAGSGNSDSAITVVGLFTGAAIAHNFKIASSADGTTPNGRIAFVICLIIVFAVAISNIQKSKGEA